MVELVTIALLKEMEVMEALVVVLVLDNLLALEDLQPCHLRKEITVETHLEIHKVLETVVVVEVLDPRVLMLLLVVEALEVLVCRIT